MTNFGTLILKQGKEKPVKNFHPWIFSGAVLNKPSSKDGDIVKVVSASKEALGYGFYSPNSQIICRMVHFGADEVQFDPSFWISKIQLAFNLRKALALENTDAYRLVHAEADLFPGVIVDIYGTCAVVQFMILGTERISTYIFQALKELGFKFVFIKSNKVSEGKEQLSMKEGWLDEKPTSEIIALEHGLKFLIDVERGQKTGFFIDQRDNRQLLGKYSKGKSVLNTFAYTGGFSVYAAAGGATRVVSMDISAEAVASCDKNVRLNVPDAIHEAVKADTFHYLRESHEKFDIIVLDPPAFAKNSHSVQNAARGYKDLNLLALKRVSKGGMVFTFSCSQHISTDLFQKIVFGAAADSGREVSIIHRLSQSADHPINIYHPEGEYLKGFVLYVK